MAIAKAEEILSFIFYRIHLIEETLREISLKRFPSQNPQIYTRLIKDICKYIKDYLLSLNRQDETFDSDQMEDRLKIVSMYVTGLASDLADINEAGGDITSWELIHPFEDFSKKLHEKILIILKPIWEFNFSIRHRLLEDHRGQLKAILSDDCFEELLWHFPKEITDIYVISFPAFEKTNILLQGNLGHELGHPLAIQYLNEQEESYITEIKHDIKEVVTVTIKSIEDEQKIKIDEIFREKIESDHLSAILKIRAYALNELISDLVAVRLFGIASILSAFEYASTIRKFDEISEGLYPPWRMRLRIMLEELSSTTLLAKVTSFIDGEIKVGKNVSLYKDISSALDAKIKELMAFTSIKKDEDFINADDSYRIAYKSIFKSLPAVKEFLNKKLPQNIQTIENDIDTIFKLCQRINYKLPPNAVEECPFEPDPADIRKIMNAGWLYKITKLSVCPSSEEDNLEFLRGTDLLNRLIFKALELADIYERFKNRKV